ncbi:MAG TPA: hypothetical protein VEP50_10025 [bacterium]|nr:hypothetical protein [bacterium]
MLQQQGIVSTNMTYDMFSYYIERTWENEEIQAYIRDEHAEDPTIYSGARRLYDIMKRRSGG